MITERAERMNTVSRGMQNSAALLAAFIFTAGTGFAADDPKAGLLVVNTGAEPRQLLAYKFTPGLFANYEVVQKQAVETKFVKDGLVGKEVMDNSAKSLKNFRVVSVDADGTAVLEPMVKKTLMRAVFNGLNPIVYDSEANEAPLPQFENIAKTVGRPLTRVTFAPNGEMLKVVPLPGAPDDVVKSAGKLDSTTNFLVVLPKDPIGIGAVWREKFSVPVGPANSRIAPPVTLQREYQLTKMDGSLATLSVRVSTLTPLTNPQVEGDLLLRQIKGTIGFDVERGLIVSQSTVAGGHIVEAYGPQTALTSKLETQERLVPPTEGVQPATLKQIGAAP